MTEEKPVVTTTETELDYAYVHRIHTDNMDHAFVRLVRTGESGRLANTIPADDCQIDVDHDGNIMGITVVWNMRP